MLEVSLRNKSWLVLGAAVSALISSGRAAAQSALSTDPVVRASVSSNGAQASALSSDAQISSSGRFVVFDSDATNLVAGDTNLLRDTFVRDRATSETTRVSVGAAGAQANALSSVSNPSPISADGRYVVFYSSATNLVAGDANIQRDVFVRDRKLGTTALVSVSSAGVQGNGTSSSPTISADGRYVAFYSSASNLVAGDTNAVRDCFVRDLLTNTTTRVSVSSAGVQGSALSSGPIISANGRYVVFYSDAPNLVAGDSNGFRDAFVRDTQTNTTTRISVSSAGAQGDKLSSDPMVSADGRFIAFYSDATNLVAGDSNAVRDVFVRDTQTNTTTRVSVSSANGQGNARSETPAISGDGNFVAFDSDATNLVAGDTNIVRDTFLRDRASGKTFRISQNAGHVQGNAASADASLSADGHYVALGSTASNLVHGDTNLVEDVFVRRIFHPDSGPPLPLVVNPQPGHSLVFKLLDPRGANNPAALPVIVVQTNSSGAALTLVGGPDGRIEIPALPALVQLQVRGLFMQRDASGRTRLTFANVELTE